MAFALTSFRAYGTEVSEAITNIFYQTLRLGFTGTAADVDINLGDLNSTFWTQINNSQAKQVFSRLKSKVDTVLVVASSDLFNGKSQVGGAPAAGQYSITQDIDNFRIRLAAGEGATSATIVIQALLKGDNLPEEVNVY